jgi:hypothetical protein
MNPAAPQSMIISPSMIEGHERTLLARFLVEYGAVERFPNLSPKHFAGSIHREIFDAIVTLHYDGYSTCFPLVEDYLHARGKLRSNGEKNFVSSIACDNRITAMNDDCFDYAVDCVLDAYRQRESARIGKALTSGGIDADSARDKLDEIIEHSKPASKSPLIEFRSPLQLKNFKPPPGIVLIGDCHIVRGSVFVIGGAPSVGKSRAAVALAEAGATRHEWFGLPVRRQFKTMIVQTEKGEFRLSREFGELDCEALENFVRVCPPPPYGLCFARAGFREQLAAAVAAFAPDVVIYDPWNAAAREQDSREYLDTFDALRSVLPFGDDAPALGIVAHTRKPKTDERASGRVLLNLLAGSYVLGSVPRTVFVMQAASDETTDNRVVWTCCKNNDGELGVRSAWERRNGLFAPVRDFDWEAFDAPEKDRRELITETDVAAIFRNGALKKAEAVKQLESNTGAHRASCYRALEPDGRFARHLLVEGERISWK